MMSDKAAIAAIRASLAILEVNREAETVYLEDLSSKRVHVGFQREIDVQPATFPSCLSPEAGNRRRITEAQANAKPDKARCLRCFPRRDGPNPDADDGADLDVPGIEGVPI